ncbi:hypothetical protein POL68_41935 [Stigmatella sp. ncwal1]|uniref:Uncharacterized protein n=1 Tax=Stigmatella ashevillensis TaxID=2995309 RepID=A0ABT5DQS9_9BACT|nr:hypothetical protein [Stigmatella ashevillena]MDC0715083.1 hypothetical protein [Stigmatella ashevillena]
MAVYRQKMITGSVMGLTGPDLIRENMYLLSLNKPWAQLPAGNLSRLVPEVEELNGVMTSWNTSPMEHVNWKTIAAKASDCRIAGMQVLKEK